MIIHLIPLHEGELGEARGIATSDLNQVATLVENSVEKVANTLIDIKGHKVWKKDAYNQVIKVYENSIFVFQLKGHSWTIILESNKRIPERFLIAEDVKKISEALKTKSFFYSGSDSAGITKYSLFDNGILLEKLYFEGEVIDFESKVRKFENITEYSGYDLAYFLLQQYDAYIPAISESEERPDDSPSPVLTPGKHCKLLFENLFTEQVERMDYLAYKEQ